MADGNTNVCPYCEKPGIKRAKQATYRRGDRSVTVTAAYWECPGDCPMPDTDDVERYPVFAWEDTTQMRNTTAQARLAWKDTYGDEMPPGRKIRRKQRPE